MPKAKEQEVTNIEQEFAPEQERMLERGRALIESLDNLNSALDDVKSNVTETIDSAPDFDEGMFDVIQAEIDKSLEELESQLEAIEEERAQLLADWETLAISTFSTHEGVSVPDISIVIESDIDGKDKLNALSQTLTQKQDHLEAVNVVRRKLSRAHKQAVSQLEGHMRVMQMIREAHAELSLTSDWAITDKRKKRVNTHNQLVEGVRDRLDREMYDRTQEIIEEKEAMYAVADDTNVHERIETSLALETIDPVIEYARGEFPTPERDELLAKLKKALQDMYSHKWEEKIPKENIEPDLGDDQYTTYRKKVRNLVSKIKKTYVWDDSSYGYLDSEASMRRTALDDAVNKVSGDATINPRDHTSNFIKMFADWRANKKFDSKVATLERPSVDAERHYHDMDLTMSDRMDSGTILLNHTKYKINRWNLLKNDPSFMAEASDDEIDGFERFVIEKIVHEVLHAGGATSDAGSDVPPILENLGRPDSIPILLDHIRYFGQGGTSVQAYGAMQRLAYEPASLEYIDEAMNPVDRALMHQVIDHDSILNRIHGGDLKSYNLEKVHHISKGELMLARAKLVELFSDSTQYSKQLRISEARAFWGGQMPDTDAVKLLMTKRELVEDRVRETADYSPWWTISGLTEALAHNPKFTESLAQELLVDEPEHQDKMKALLGHKKVTRSAQNKSAILNGVLLFRAKGDLGREMLGEVMAGYQGTKDDPSRVRKLFRSFEILDRFDSLTFDYDVSEKLQAIEDEERKLNALSPTQDKHEKKKRRQKTRHLALQKKNLMGLSGMVDHYTRRAGELVSDRLKLESDTSEKLISNLDRHVESGLIDIATTLLATLEAKKVEEPKVVLQNVVAGVVEGNFREWKYTHNASEKQISFLDDEKKETWIQNIEPVTLEQEELTEEQEKEQKIATAKSLLRDVRSHLSDEEYMVDDPDELVELKSKLDTIDGLLDNPDSEIDDIYDVVRSAESQATSLRLRQVASDLTEVMRSFTAKMISGKLTAEEFDDPLRLIKMGTEPTETCQSWKKGLFSECLLAYVADANKKGINVIDEEKIVRLRAVERITESRLQGEIDESANRTTLFLEPPYLLTGSPEVFKAFAELVFNKAEAMGAVVQLSSAKWGALLEDMQRVAESRGYTMDFDVIRQIRLAPSINKMEYSDSFEGKIEAYNQYKEHKVVEFRK